jgi:hypothetical protein
MKIKLPQQALNLLRAYLQQPGWAKTTKEIYLGGKLLAETLPEPDITWVRGDDQLQAMTREERQAYRAADRVWCEQEVELELSDQERDTCRKAIEKLTEAGTFGVTKYSFRLFDAFGFKPE